MLLLNGPCTSTIYRDFFVIIHKTTSDRWMHARDSPCIYSCSWIFRLHPQAPDKEWKRSFSSSSHHVRVRVGEAQFQYRPQQAQFSGTRHSQKLKSTHLVMNTCFSEVKSRTSRAQVSNSHELANNGLVPALSPSHTRD